MSNFILILVSGVNLGGVYALVAIGIVLPFRATHTFNFAHGEFIALPAFIVGALELSGEKFYPAAGLAVLISAAIGFLTYRFVLYRTTGMPAFMGIIATFGLATILDGVIGIRFRAEGYSIEIPGVPSGIVVIAGVRVTASSLTFTILTVALCAVVTSGLRYTSLGTRLRAAGQDSLLAAQGGIEVRRYYIGTWVLAAILAAVAGISYGSATVVNTSLVQLGLAVVPAVVLGGLDSVEGAFVGGMLVGMVQSATTTYLGGTYVDAVTYGSVLVLLLFIPQGLFGSREIARV